MKKYILLVEGKNSTLKYSFEASSEEKAKRNAKRIANGRNIVSLQCEDTEA